MKKGPKGLQGPQGHQGRQGHAKSRYRALWSLVSLASLVSLLSFFHPVRGETMQLDSVKADTTETPVTLEVDGLRFPARLTVPAAGDPVAAIVLIPGSLFIDVDGDPPIFKSPPPLYPPLAPH